MNGDNGDHGPNVQRPVVKEPETEKENALPIIVVMEMTLKLTNALIMNHATVNTVRTV